MVNLNLKNIGYKLGLTVILAFAFLIAFFMIRNPAEESDQEIIEIIRQIHRTNTGLSENSPDSHNQAGELDLLLQKLENIQLERQQKVEAYNYQEMALVILFIALLLHMLYLLVKIRSNSRAVSASNSLIQNEVSRLKTTFSSIGDAVITTDAKGNIDYMNEVAEDLTHYPFEQVKSLKFDETFMLFTELHHYIDRPVRQALASEEVIKVNNNVLLRRKDGKQVPVIYTISPIHNSDSQVIGAIIIFHDSTETHKRNKALSWQATHDPLTKLPNRVLLKSDLEQALDKAIVNETMLTLLFIDLDDFKPVNDLFGHYIGDKVLVIIAQRLKNAVRNNDTVARLGGDEFVITLISGSDEDEITAALKRIMAAIAEPIQVPGSSISLSASIGVTSYPFDNSDADTLLRHADQAMYAAKEKGRNQYHFFDVESAQLSTRKGIKCQAIENALKNNEFELHYQPKVNMRTGSIVGVEALIRWRHPEQGLIMPDDFLLLAEETNLIIDIGDWVVEQACGEMANWQAQGHYFDVAINIAPRQFQDSDFITKIKTTLSRFPALDASYIELEIVESAALSDIGSVIKIIRECHEMGMKVSLDDFGTGYASLTYLKQLPADMLKIDKSFVRDMLEDEGDLAIVKGITSLSSIFHYQPVAEGVETTEHGIMLLRLGCDIAQGYGISRPMPAEQVIPWIENWNPEPTWLAWSETSWDISDFPLVIAQSDHCAGVNKVISCIENIPSDGELFNLVDHFHCRLGHWYYGIGKEKYGQLSNFKSLASPHEKTHRIGRDLLDLHAQGMTERAKARIPELVAARDSVIKVLGELQNEILSLRQ